MFHATCVVLNVQTIGFYITNYSRHGIMVKNNTEKTQDKPSIRMYLNLTAI